MGSRIGPLQGASMLQTKGFSYCWMALNPPVPLTSVMVFQNQPTLWRWRWEEHMVYALFPLFTGILSQYQGHERLWEDNVTNFGPLCPFGQCHVPFYNVKLYTPEWRKNDIQSVDFQNKNTHLCWGNIEAVILKHTEPFNVAAEHNLVKLESCLSTVGHEHSLQEPFFLLLIKKS